MLRTKILLDHYYLLILVSAWVEAKSTQSNYDFPIAGGRTFEECINGKRPKNWDPEMYTTSVEFARELGYRTEEHVVVTEDGYILTIHRIPGPDGARPIFLQHGFGGSSFNFLMTGKNKALAFILADKGYDVWLGNFRGTTYSMCHTKYTPSEYKYWNFSVHETGVFDLPTQITYITNITKQDIIYVGHSMGTTASYVMAIERPDIASKIKALFSLAPVAYFYNLKDPIKYLAPFVRIFEILAKFTEGKIPWFPKTFIKYFCSLTVIQEKICITVAFIFFGFDYEQFDYNILPTLSYHVSDFPIKVLNYYFHERNSGRFMHYDYGKSGNLRMYNSIEAPDYDISKIKVPVGLFWATNDYVADQKDVLKFYNQLPNKILNYKVEYPNFNHLDFVLAKEAPKYVYSKLLAVLEDYR